MPARDFAIFSNQWEANACHEPNVGLDLPMHGKKLIHLVSQSLSRNVILPLKAAAEKVGRAEGLFML
jgi:hypothetical protein